MQGTVATRFGAEQGLLDRFRGLAGSRTETEQTASEWFSDPSLRAEQPTQNWSGQGESDCLIKTKHCDGANAC